MPRQVGYIAVWSLPDCVDCVGADRLAEAAKMESDAVWAEWLVGHGGRGIMVLLALCPVYPLCLLTRMRQVILLDQRLQRPMAQGCIMRLH